MFLYKKSKFGDMTMFGLILALILFVIFSPIFSYVHSRQSITESTNLIKSSLKSYSESVFNELYDEAKSINQNNYIYSELINNSDIEKELPNKVLQKSGFKLQSDESGTDFYYISDSRIKITNPIVSISKEDDTYHFKLLYDAETPLSILGINFYTYKNTYMTVCDINRNGFNYSDTEETSVDYKNDYIYKVSLGANNENDIIGYVTLKADGTRVLYLEGKGKIKDEDQFVVELFDGTKVNTATYPWASEIYYTDPITSEYQTITLLDEVHFVGEITNIPNKLLYNIGPLAKVDMGTSVQSIGDYAFYNCIGLANEPLIIPKSVKSIGVRAFCGCDIQELILQDGVEKIDGAAFMYNNLKKLYIPSSVKEISDSAFAYNESLNSVMSPWYINNAKKALISNNAFNNTLVDYIQCADGMLKITNTTE